MLEEADEGGDSSARPHHHEGHRYVGRGSEGAGRSQAHVDLDVKAISNQTPSKKKDKSVHGSTRYSGTPKLKSDNRNAPFHFSESLINHTQRRQGHLPTFNPSFCRSLKHTGSVNA